MRILSILPPESSTVVICIACQSRLLVEMQDCKIQNSGYYIYECPHCHNTNNLIHGIEFDPEFQEQRRARADTTSKVLSKDIQ